MERMCVLPSGIQQVCLFEQSIITNEIGQEKYRSMVSMYYRGSMGAMIVYDVTQTTSFESVRMWYNELTSSEKEAGLLFIQTKYEKY